jgi:hypothetical protein
VRSVELRRAGSLPVVWGHAAADGGIPPRSGRRWSWTPFSFDDESSLLTLRWRPPTSDCHCPARPCGTEGQAREKSPLRADDGDACGRRPLLEGVVMASTALSHPRALGETLCPTRRTMRRRRHGVVSSLGASCELLAESPGGWWSWLWS